MSTPTDVTYEQHLATRRLADRADVLREALLHLDVCPIQPADLRIELPTIIWTPLERRLLDALPGARVTPRASVAAKRTPQSTAPSAVASAIAESDAWIGRAAQEAAAR